MHISPDYRLAGGMCTGYYLVHAWPNIIIIIIYYDNTKHDLI